MNQLIWSQFDTCRDIWAPLDFIYTNFCLTIFFFWFCPSIRHPGNLISDNIYFVLFIGKFHHIKSRLKNPPFIAPFPSYSSLTFLFSLYPTHHLFLSRTLAHTVTLTHLLTFFLTYTPALFFLFLNSHVRINSLSFEHVLYLSFSQTFSLSPHIFSHISLSSLLFDLTCC